MGEGFLDVDGGFLLDLHWIWGILGCACRFGCNRAGCWGAWRIGSVRRQSSSVAVVPCSDGRHGECMGQVGLAVGGCVWQAVAWGRWVNPCSMSAVGASGMVLAMATT